MNVNFLIAHTSPMASNSNNVGSTSKLSIEKDNTWVPEGFVCILAPDEKQYMVPEYMVPAIFQQFNAKTNMEDLNVLSASGTVSCNIRIQRSSILGYLPGIIPA
jgi:hypothetical protein